MPTTPTIDLTSALKEFGGTAGLHARLVKSPYAPGGLEAATVRGWKSRGALPGWAVLPVMLLLRDAGRDPMDFVTGVPEEPETPNPFEGLTLCHTPRKPTETAG